MPYAFVAEVSAGTAASGTTQAINVTYAAGDKAVIRIGWGSNTSITRTGFSDGTNTYTQVGSDINGTGSAGESHAIYICDSTAAGSVTLTVTWASAVAFREVSVMRYTGLGTSYQTYAGQCQSAQGTGANAYTTGLMSPSTQPAAVIGWCQSLNGNAVSAGTGYTDRGTSTTSDSTNGVKTRLMDKRITATSQLALTGTTSTDTGFYFTVGVIISEPATSDTMMGAGVL